PLKQKLARLAQQISIAGISAAILIFVIMGIEETIKAKELLAALSLNQGMAIGMTVGALILGFILMKSALTKFFSSMDVELDNVWKQLAGVIPMAIASFMLFLCIWGFTDVGLRPHAMVLMRELLTAFMVAVTIIVVAVPEGLPMMVTICLALNMMKMAKQNCLVRRLIASETIGSATVICTDKTGTLTENKMTPVWFFMGMHKFTGDETSKVTTIPEWETISRGICVNSEAQLEEKDGALVGVGNATECALLKFLNANKIDYRTIREKFARAWQLDYNSQRKRSIAVINVDDQDICYIKGAPERIVAACTHISVNGELRPIEDYRKDIEDGILEASNQALRVIAFSQKISDKGQKFEYTEDGCCNNQVFLGMVGIIDPLRKEVPGAVANCHKAGIEVKMITGDALPTARAIAKGAGILTEGGLIMTSQEFNEISEEDLPEKAQKLQVLARSTPMDKYKIVQALHKVGAVVAMTGDGTNDAPALKAADVGLSMGITGTEVAKEASDIVLVDDNFKSILTGVWWGRTLYQNIQRFLQFQLTVNVVALLAAFIGPIVGCDLPLTVPQLLWVNIIMDTFAALALSTDPPRANTMDRKPISREAHLITPAIGLNLVLMGIYQLIVLYIILLGDIVQGDPATNITKQTVFFTVFVLFQFWNIFNCRALRSDESIFTGLVENKAFIGIVTAIFVGQVLMVSIGGPVGEIFRTEPLSARMWLNVLLLTFSVIPVGWLIRMICHWSGVEDKVIESKEEAEEAA
ncbi:calcium-translocating P-type ATPase, PMCA-type, partial [bacterium]|nr:calcium-translocating P-type ATPase, PMCA-type [bacterium]